MASVSAQTQEHPASGLTATPNRPAIVWFFADAIAVARRYVIGMSRTPDVLAFVIVQPSSSCCCSDTSSGAPYASPASPT